MKAKIFCIWLCTFLFGALVAPFFENYSNTYLYLSLTLIVVSFAVFSRKYLWAIIFGFGVLFIAIYLFQIQTNYCKNSNIQLAEKEIEYTAIIDDLPSETELGFASRIKISEPQNATGQKAILYFDSGNYQFGERIRFQGKLKKYTEEKQNRMISQKIIGEISTNKIEKIGKNVSFSVRGFLLNIRDKMNHSLGQLLPTKEAGLASGLILGEKALIPADLKRSLQASGTTHIIALSGYNITIILSLFVLLKNRASRLVNLVVPFLFALFFIIMTGASASIVRAGIMGFMPALARFLGRPRNSIIALLLSAAIMTAFNPYILLFDVGFQLSFLAMIGLTYIAPIIARFIRSESNILQIFSETLGAQIAVLPLIIFYFGQVSVISPISNMIILSLVPLGMLVSFLTGLFGIIFPLLGRLIAIPSFIVLNVFYLLIDFFGQLPFASVQFKIDQPIWILILYLLLIDLIVLFKKRSDRLPTV